MQVGTSPVVIPNLIRLPALNPVTGNHGWSVEISKAMLEHLENNGPLWKFCNAALLPEALENPAVILQGLNRVGYDGAYCYSRIPSCRWVDEYTSTTPLPHTVFVVFVSSLAQPNVLDWEWRLADTTYPGYPKRWERDFTRQVWPPTN